MKENTSMQSIIPLIIAGLFVYLVFFRRGRGGMGMGCCGGHFGHDSESPQNKTSGPPPGEPIGNVIDLKKKDYTVLPSNENPLNRQLPR
jgi:hypothetical protein